MYHGENMLLKDASKLALKYSLSIKERPVTIDYYSDAYEYFKSKNLIEFISTSFIRGITLNDCIIIVDEIANMTLHELDSVITRVGKNCRIIFCGDFRQSDFTRDHEKNGLTDFMKIIKRMKSFHFVDFNENDIVRSSMVKDYIIQKDRMKIVA